MTDLQLKAFIAAAETLNFTTASARLYMTQSTLSRQISALENELGVKLFRRQNNTLTLTETGKYFYEPAGQLIAQLEQAVAQMHDLDTGIKGKLNIGIMADQNLLPVLIEAIRSLVEQNPALKINVEHCSYANLIEKLNHGEIDAAQALIYEGLPPERYRQMILTREPMYLAYNKNYMSFEKAYIQDDFDILNKLGSACLYYPTMESYPECIRRSLPPLKPLFTAQGKGVDSPTEAQLYIKLGFGTTLVNQNNIIASDPDVGLIPISTACSPEVAQGLIWRTDTTNPVLQHLFEHLEDFRLDEE